MIRYGILIGDHDSFRVTIPREWVEKNEMKKGDYVRIDEAPDGSLRIEKADR